MKAIIATISLALFIFGTLVPAQAKHRHHHRHSHHHYTHKHIKKHIVTNYQTTNSYITDDRYQSGRKPEYSSNDYSAKRYTGEFQPVSRAVSTRGEVIGRRPSGCPSRFCGCALSLHLFGRIVPGLNLAANWLRFPGAAPSPGMVAARHGHVFKLVAHVGGSTWRVWDANSGGGRIRVHNRSIAGFKIVNPSRG